MRWRDEGDPEPRCQVWETEEGDRKAWRPKYQVWGREKGEGSPESKCQVLETEEGEEEAWRPKYQVVVMVVVVGGGLRGKPGDQNTKYGGERRGIGEPRTENARCGRQGRQKYRGGGRGGARIPKCQMWETEEMEREAWRPKYQVWGKEGGREESPDSKMPDVEDRGGGEGRLQAKILDSVGKR